MVRNHYVEEEGIDNIAAQLRRNESEVSKAYKHLQKTRNTVMSLPKLKKVTGICCNILHAQVQTVLISMNYHGVIYTIEYLGKTELV